MPRDRLLRARAGRSGARRESGRKAGRLGAALPSRSARARRSREAAAPSAEAAPTRQIAHPDARDRGINHLMEAAELAALVKERQPCVVLTGAGISTESGIPDFRSPTGIWAEVDPFEVASIQAFRRDPERVWSFYRERIHIILDARPNAAHEAIATLEGMGLVQTVVTQNIDLLHS